MANNKPIIAPSIIHVAGPNLPITAPLPDALAVRMIRVDTTIEIQNTASKTTNVTVAIVATVKSVTRFKCEKIEKMNTNNVNASPHQ